MPLDRARRLHRPSPPSGAAARSGQAEEGRPPLPAAAAGPPPPPEPRDPLLGQTIGGYTVLRRLATGPALLTFLADQPAMGRRVTLLVLADQAAADDATLLSFYRSARFAARTHHPSLLAIYDVSSAGTTHYCALECVEARSVGDLLRAREKVLPDDALRVTVDVAEALRAANQSGVPGLVLALDDILLTDRGEVKLRLPTFAGAEAPGMDDRYVLRAAGVLLYALLSGGRAEGVEAALAPGSEAAAQFPPLKSVVPSTRQDLAQAVGRMLGAGPGEGFSSLDSALAALRDLLQTQAKVDTRLRSTTDRVRRQQKKSHLAALLGLAAVGAVVLVIAIVLLTRGSAARRLRQAYDAAVSSVRTQLQQAEALQKDFQRAPSLPGAEAVIAAYRQAGQAYRDFLAAYPQAEQRDQVAAHLSQIDAFIPVFWADARHRIQRAAVMVDIKEVDGRLKGEIAQKKKTGGTLDLAAWRTQFGQLIPRHGGSAEVAQAVLPWLESLPRILERGQMEIDAEQVLRDCETRHVPKQDFRACIAAWDAFQEKYRPKPALRDEAAKRHGEELNKVRRGAALAYHQLQGEAEKLVKAKDLKGARALYRKAVDTFGFDSLVEKAKQELAKLPKE
jgi:hypothetical protein